MSERDRTYYLNLRREYEPTLVTLVIVAESPPASGKYFYDPTGGVTEPLFSAFMRQLQISPATKAEGLREFLRKGWILVDATYEQVNALKGAKRNRVICRDYPLLRNDLVQLTPNRSSPLVLIKANVCRILEPKLVQDGFKVLNHGRAVHFPSHGWQKQFAGQFNAILSSA